MLKLILCGAGGRMGREIIRAVHNYEDTKIIAGIEEKDSQLIGKTIDGVMIYNDILAVIKNSDCVVEFTNPDATIENLRRVVNFKKSYCIGTTGFSESQIKEIKDCARDFPIFLSPNMSVGVNHLLSLVRDTTRILKDYDIEIIETHHRQKKDSPSGTAKAIAKVIKEVKHDAKFIHGREGIVGERKSDEIGISAVRGGDVIGEHRVMFLGNGEFVELRHYATSRQCFAYGTLLAVRFILKQKPGLYSMDDLVKSISRGG